MPALYFFRRENDNDHNNGLKAPSATDDDYHSYKQISVKVLKKSQGVLFTFTVFTQRLVIGHVYEVNIPIDS